MGRLVPASFGSVLKIGQYLVLAVQPNVQRIRCVLGLIINPNKKESRILKKKKNRKDKSYEDITEKYVVA